MNSPTSILLLEDDLDIREALENILEEEGYLVQSASNGKRALDLLSTVSVLPSLILLDLMMPEMNGFEFRSLQLQDPRLAPIPTIVLSAGGSHQELEPLQFQECLSKPLDLMTLIDVVKRNIS